MRLSISYIEGQGWHVGRPLWVPVMLALGLPVGLVMQLLEIGVALATHHVVPIGWLTPLFALWMARSRLARIRARGYQILDRPFRVNFSRVDVARPDENPGLWRLLYRAEVVIWTLVVLSWSIVPVTAYVEAHRPRPARKALSSVTRLQVEDLLHLDPLLSGRSPG